MACQPRLATAAAARAHDLRVCPPLCRNPTARACGSPTLSATMRTPPGISVTNGSGAVVTFGSYGEVISPQHRYPRSGQRTQSDQGEHWTRHGFARTSLTRVAHAEQPTDDYENGELDPDFRVVQVGAGRPRCRERDPGEQ